MRKSLLVLALSASLLLAGCTANSSQTLNQLSSQIDSTAAFVETTSSSEVSTVSPSIEFDANSTPSNIQTYKATAYQNMIKEESMRQDILSISAAIKSCTGSNCKLTKSQTKAITTLNNNLNKYTTQLKNTIPYVKSNVNKITKSLSLGENGNRAEAESYYISLNNNMNDRYAYMSNLYANLQEIYNIVCCCNCQQNENNCQQEEITTQESTPVGDNSNIDTFTNSANNTPPAIPTPSIQPASYNGYNYTYNRGTFNPDRNTDSFYPRIRNIDTYRINPNSYYNGYYNNGYYNGANYQPLPMQ